MNLDKVKEAASLYKTLAQTESQIEFFKQFVPKDPSFRTWWFKGKSPKLSAYLWTTDSDYKHVSIDDETTDFLIKSFEAKRDRILKEIDAL